ncbi:MAG: phage holin family protein [Flavobacteriaceae bacterium]|nr:phage holin family protein [Flavobacteriaceae bacterium]
MKTMFVNLLITAIVSYVLQMLLSGVHFEGFGTAIIFAIVLGLLNAFVKPVLKMLSLPLTVITMGLFSLVINTVVMLLAEFFVQGVHIDGILWALIFSVLLSFVTSAISSKE